LIALRHSSQHAPASPPLVSFSLHQEKLKC
jgi:hypothetical protein